MQEELYFSLLVISATINLSVGIFFILAPIFFKLLSKCTEEIRDKICHLHSQKPGLTNKFFRDLLFHTMMFGLGIYVLHTTDVLRQPFFGLPPITRISLCIAIGNHIYKLVQDILLRDQLTTLSVNLLHQLVAVFSYTVFLTTKQNAIMGMIGLIFEGNVIFFEIGRLLKFLQMEKRIIYSVILIIGFITTFSIRAVFPVYFLLQALRSSNPFNMDYFPLATFFLNCIFFSMVNLWLIKVSFMSMLRCLRRHRWSMQRRSDDTTENLRLDIYTNRFIYSNEAPLVDESTLETLSEGLINNARVQPVSLSRHMTIPVSNFNINASQIENTQFEQSDGNSLLLRNLDNSFDMSQ